MRAAVYHSKHDIRVEDVKEPGPLGPRDVRLRPYLCGICGTDLHEYAAGPIVIPTTPHPLSGAAAPQILGHEFSGEVLEAGAEAGVRPGDRVSVMPLVYCGQCYYCRRGLNHLCPNMACTGLSWHGGGISEQVVVPDYQLTVLPEAVSDVQGALIEPAAVAAYGVDRTGLAPGDTILITGAGPIGALSALYAHAAGASQVIVSEPNARRRQLLDAFGIATVLDPGDTGSVADAVRDLTGGIGVDTAAECSGSQGGLTATLESVRSHGTVTQVGLHVRPATFDPMALSNRDLSLIGTWCYPVYDFPRITALVAAGRYPVEKVLTEVIPVEDIVPRGFDRLLDPDGDAQKLLVKVAS